MSNICFVILITNIIDKFRWGGRAGTALVQCTFSLIFNLLYLDSFHDRDEKMVRILVEDVPPRSQILFFN